MVPEARSRSTCISPGIETYCRCICGYVGMIRKKVERIRMNGNLTGRHEGSKGVLNSEYVEHRSVSRESQATRNLMEAAIW